MSLSLHTPQLAPANGWSKPGFTEEIVHTYRVYAHGVLWHELTVVHVWILSSLVLTFKVKRYIIHVVSSFELTLAVWNGTVVPALEADVVGVLGARHVAPRPAVSLVRVSAVVVPVPVFLFVFVFVSVQ